MFPRLPHWVIPNKFPAFYDSESVTAIEMTAKIYKHVENLIDDYNKFVDNMNKAIEDFENGVTTDVELFKVSIRQEFQDFIDIVELKLKDQDLEIQKAYDYLVNNLRKTVQDTVEKEIQKGTLAVGVSYLEDTESLNLVAIPQPIDPFHDVQYDETNETITII